MHVLARNAPYKGVWKLLHDFGRMRPGIAIQQADSFCQYVSPFILNCLFQYLLWVLEYLASVVIFPEPDIQSKLCFYGSASR